MYKKDNIQSDNIRMALNVKILKGNEYLYFQAGKSSIYIGPKSDPSKVKADNVVRALEYAWERSNHYDKSIDELLLLLPPDLHKQYSTEEISRLNSRISKWQSKKTHSRTTATHRHQSQHSRHRKESPS